MTTTRLYVPLDRGAGTGDSMVINVAELLKSSRKNAMEEDDKDVAADNSDENDQEDQDEDQEEEQEGVAPNASGEKADVLPFKIFVN